MQYRQEAASIRLGQEAPFALGPLLVRPMDRSIVAGDGKARTLEPRVMQVLVALGRAQGGVVSRDALIARCWDGRIVSDAAINRTIAQLRALAAHGEAFRIETIAGVGYRLVAPDPPAAPESGADAGAGAADAPDGSDPAFAGAAPPLPAQGEHPSPRDAARAGLPRRAMLAAGLAGATALAGAALWRQRAGRPAGGAGDDRLAGELVARGRALVREGSFGRSGDAVALLVRATGLAPGRADAWGVLALAYRQNVAAPLDRDWVRASAARALALDPDNADAQVALAINRRFFGNWLDIERDIRRLVERFPDHWQLGEALGWLMMGVGRFEEAERSYGALVAGDPMLPAARMEHALALWGRGEVIAAEQALAGAAALWPGHPWLLPQRMLFETLTGRPAEAIANLEAARRRSYSTPAVPLDLARQCALALRDGRPDAIAGIAAVQLAQGAATTALAEHAVLFLAATGRLDDAFEWLTRHYGLAVGAATRPGPAAGPSDVRWTHVLFLPPARPLRSDPRFPALMSAIGLAEYWRRSGSRPDVDG